jgi:hypothetical protein
MMDKTQFPRTQHMVQSQIESLKKTGWDFMVQHGTYTTKIHKPTGILTFSTIQFRNKVFVAANMVKRDAKQSDKGQEIMNSVFRKNNYANSDTTEVYLADEVWNIDIKSAYANCLFVNGLIKGETLGYLQGLKKHERLPSVGMLAKSHIKYWYSEGECFKVEPHREPTAQIFFFLIHEIDRVMREIKWILGDYFLYYWVDGVFFKKETPTRLIVQVEEYLKSENYPYAWEMCYNFDYFRHDGNVKVKMIKSGVRKEWNFKDSNFEDDLVKRYLQNESQKKRTNRVESI